MIFCKQWLTVFHLKILRSLSNVFKISLELEVIAIHVFVNWLLNLEICLAKIGIVNRLTTSSLILKINQTVIRFYKFFMSLNCTRSIELNPKLNFGFWFLMNTYSTKVSHRAGPLFKIQQILPKKAIICL